MNYKDPQNNLHALDSAEFEHLLPVGSIQITDEEAAQIATDKIIPPTYRELRAAAYPSFADQFDLIYHGGTALWKEAIDAVKTKYPKEV